jgi:hypothetical protein
LNKESKFAIQYLPLMFLGISLCSLIILSILPFRFSTMSVSFPFHKELVGSLFILICVVGIVLGVFPSKCSGILHFSTSTGSNKKDQTILTMTKETFTGHHPTCHHFKSHILHLTNKTLCAGCTGLIIGALISIFGSFLYFFLDFSIEYGEFILLLGFLGVLFGLLQYHLPHMESSNVHLFVNGTFVLGALLLLIGVDTMTSNFFLQVYLLIIILFWIITRIFLSQFEHQRICAVCDVKKCTYV